jgi:hypothetical protein
MWVLLAAFFGLIGFALYALGIDHPGDDQIRLLGISFTLKDAGPGLVVMIMGLACAVVGATRAKVVITPRSVTFSAPEKSPEKSTIPETVVGVSSRECKVFDQLLDYLAEERGAFAILNSRG